MVLIIERGTGGLEEGDRVMMVRERGSGESELVHHPVGLHAFGGPTFVEDKGLLEANALVLVSGVDGSICACGLPKSSPSHSIWPCAVPVLSISWAVEVPFLLSSCCKLFRFFIFYFF